MITVEEVAKGLNVTQATVRFWLKTGRLKGVKAGKQWRIMPEELREMIPFGVLFGSLETSNDAVELAKKVYPDQWKMMQEAHEATTEEIEEEALLNKIRRPYREEIALRFPYPYNDDEVVSARETGEPWYGDDLEVYHGYYEDKLKEEQKKFDKLLEMLQKKYNVQQKETDEIKRTAENIRLFMLAGYKGGDESI
ncbi:helix-turn-helix domain-containing protein [Sporomusa sphaeroides DSM 2875]|uniref:helix-turn-helix domain-containing protein n=1 Tax=Sporomusa sphaeroides TaxID=47679 RepID=UPI0020301A76|nr:helix-turn-helix domain-containing protein [Sporomusa sphaeroides]MCM0758495.1 helix-turn-helix domain-containing protein [Sporomusa sphaeroides DSM 2875]